MATLSISELVNLIQANDERFAHFPISATYGGDRWEMTHGPAGGLGFPRGRGEDSVANHAAWLANIFTSAPEGALIEHSADFSAGYELVVYRKVGDGFEVAYSEWSPRGGQDDDEWWEALDSRHDDYPVPTGERGSQKYRAKFAR